MSVVVPRPAWLLLPLLAAAAIVASCASAGMPPVDPMTGRYVVSTGGGALAQIQALTTRFSELHPAVRWSIENVGSDAASAWSRWANRILAPSAVS